MSLFSVESDFEYLSLARLIAQTRYKVLVRFISFIWSNIFKDTRHPPHILSIGTGPAFSYFFI